MITLMYFMICMNWYSKTVMAVACSNNFNGNQTELLMFLIVTTASVVDAVLICII